MGLIARNAPGHSSPSVRFHVVAKIFLPLPGEKEMACDPVLR